MKTKEEILNPYLKTIKRYNTEDSQMVDELNALKAMEEYKNQTPSLVGSADDKKGLPCDPVTRPEINGWEVTYNQNGVEMATIKRDALIEAICYMDYLESKSLPQSKITDEDIEKLTLDYINHNNNEDTMHPERQLGMYDGFKAALSLTSKEKEEILPMVIIEGLEDVVIVKNEYLNLSKERKLAVAQSLGEWVDKEKVELYKPNNL